MLKIQNKGVSFSQLRENVDIIIIFGGDGTFLHTAQHFFGSEIPLLGVNLGNLGFLTEIEIHELEKAFTYLLEEDYQVEKRMILESRIIKENNEIIKSQALNDIVLHRGAKPKLIKIDLFINEEIVHSYRADGIIIATPVGSTAYSLSAGGPIVNPQIRAIIVTPICPHTLYVRPMVISDRERLRIIASGESLMNVAADGRLNNTFSSGDQLLIEASSQDISLIKLPGRTFYTILHKKMRVGLI
jgi:NAD+ kinase